MGIRLIQGLHLTATNKRHIQELLDAGHEAGGTKTLHYRFTGREGNRVSLVMSKKESDSRGRMFWRSGSYVVDVTA